MKNILKYTAALISLIFAFTSCIKDDGNYDYKSIPSLQIEGLDIKVNGEKGLIKNDQLIANQGDLLQIDVIGEEIAGFAPDYRWYVTPKKQQSDADGNYIAPTELGTDKNLNEPIKLSPGEYVVFFKAKDKNNGFEAITSFELNVQSINGLYVLTTTAANQGDYSVVRTEEMDLSLKAEELGVIYNAFSNSNSGLKINKPTNLFTRTNNPKAIIVAVEGGLYNVNYSTLKLVSNDYRSFYVYYVPEGTINITGHLNGGLRKEYMIDRGNLHVINYTTMGATYRFGSAVNPYGEYYSPQVIGVVGSVGATTVTSNIFFNETKKKFQATMYDIPAEFSATAGVPGAVNLADTKMNLIYMSGTSGAAFNAVMQDPVDNKLYFVKFNLSKTSEGTCTDKIDLSIFTKITATSKWAYAARGNAAFVSNGNEVNIFNHATGALDETNNIKLPAGAEVAQMYVLSDTTNPTHDNAVLYVAYNVGDKGFVLQYEFDPLSGAIAQNSKKEFTGFDKILKLVLKK